MKGATSPRERDRVAKQKGAAKTKQGKPTRAGAKKKRPNQRPRVLRGDRAKAVFLIEYGLCGIVLRSALKAGVGRQTVYAWLKDDARFKELMEAAKEDATDRLEEEARRRGQDGWNEPVYQVGERVGIIRKFDSALLQMMIKANRASLYRDRQEVTGKDGKDLIPGELGKLSDAEIEATIARLLAKGQQT